MGARTLAAARKMQANPMRGACIRTVLALAVVLSMTGCGRQTTIGSEPQPDASPRPASSADGVSSPQIQATPIQVSAPIAACTSPAALTPQMTEGPFFKANSPARMSLFEPGMTGTKLVLTGYVLTTECKPIAHAQLDFWQANANGQYDNSGYTLRGHEFTDEAGHYHLTTIVPGPYPGRTEHIHVKVKAPNGSTLTTQLFFPGMARNQADSIFDHRLVLSVQSSSDGEVAAFNFVVNTRGT